MSLHKISSPMCKIMWAGWESNTRRLQDSGWQLSAEQDLYSMRFRFAIKHPNFRIYGLTQLMDYRDYVEFQDNIGREYPPLVVQYMASRMEINVMDDLSAFQPIDAEPQLQIDHKQKDIEDFLIFRPINKAKEIIIPENSIQEMMDMIIDKQDPKQAQIREKKRKQWRKFTREVNEGATIEVEKEFNNRDDIVAQLVCIR